MADTVFRVEVGAETRVSTQRMKNDIQNILNNISQTPPEVTIGVAKTSTERQINHDLNALFQNNGKAQFGITLGLLGGGNIRGSSGKAITKDLLAITSTLSQQKAAKVTVHIDTQATQKAMMAELKKLNLAVTITGGNSNNTDKQHQKDLQAEKQTIKEMARLRMEQYAWQQRADKAAENSRAKADAQSRANSYESQYNNERDTFLQTDAAKRLGVTSTALDDEVRTLDRVNNAYERVGHTVEVVADRTEKANERIQKSNDKTAQRTRSALFSDAATAQKGIYDTQALLAKTDKNDANYQTLTDRLNRYTASLAQLKTRANQEFGVSDAEFDKEVLGYEKVAKAAENYTIALQNNAKAQKNRDDKDALKNIQREKSIDSQIDAAIGKLNTGSSAGIEWKEKFEGLRESLKTSGASATEASQQIHAYGREAKEAGALAETASQKFSRMLGTKVGYAAVTLLMNQVTRGIRQIYTNVVELDTGMTELKKVTDETDETYQRFLDGAASRAKTLGSTMSNVVSATASFARLGYSLDEATELADAAVVYAHVGDEVESIDEASNSVISTMQAFGVEAKDVMSIVDKFNTIGKQNCPAA